MSVHLWMDPSSLLLGGIVLLLFVLFWGFPRRPPGAPPGPGPALPLVGHLHLMSSDPRAQMWRWRRQYGDVFSVYVGSRLGVMLTSYSAIYDALVTFADVFGDRPHVFLFDNVIRTTGVLGSSGDVWKEQRNVSLKILREMGMGKNSLAEKIREEITHYVQAIKGLQGAPVDLRQMTQVSVSNIICSIAMGKRYEYTDPEFIKYLHYLDKGVQLSAGSAHLNYLPWLQYLPGNARKVISAFESIQGFIEQQVADHKRALEEGHVESTDVIFKYLQLMQDQKSCGSGETTLNEDGLVNVVEDLFSAGTETTTTTLSWTLLFFLHHPHVQDTCFREISNVIGLHRPPSMSDKPKLTYLAATIQEVQRKGDVVPMIFRSANCDVNFRGYTVPRNTIVLLMLHCVLQDPEIWGDPENFRPERFIGPDGKLIRPEEFIPFGKGRRVCLGESLAQMELFLYLVTLIQHFHFLPCEQEPLPSVEGQFGVTLFPRPYRIRAVPRVGTVPL